MSKPGMKQLEVAIMGNSYLLACPDGGEATLLDAVDKVDSAMCRIRDAGKVKARDRIAVLASLNIAFELSQKEALAFNASSFGHTEDPAQADSATAADASMEARLLQLVRRLDQALEDDGQLL
jgi:cell division protein ZapA